VKVAVAPLPTSKVKPEEPAITEEMVVSLLMLLEVPVMVSVPPLIV
jgi:hypothetical protein